jgi:hypothetical protein
MEARVMNNGVAVTIPEQLYERVRRVAQRQQRDVDDLARDMLEKGISPLESLPLQPEREREKEAFRRLHPALLTKHSGKYVAIHGGELVDHDADPGALLARIESRFPNQFVLIRPVRSEPEIVYYHRATRWA